LQFYSVQERLGIFSDSYVLTSTWDTGRSLLDEIHHRAKLDSPFSNLEQFSIAYGIIQGIARLHKEGICHGNIRPEYVLLKKQDSTQLKSCIFPNLDAIGAPFLAAQRKLLESYPGARIYGNEDVIRLLNKPRGPWIKHDPNRDIQAVGVLLSSVFHKLSPIVNSLCEQLVSVPNEPTDWTIAGKFLDSNGPLSDLSLKLKIKQSLDLDNNQDLEPPKSRDISAKKMRKSIEYERTPPLKIKDIDIKDISAKSPRISHQKQTASINLLSSNSPREDHKTDERNPKPFVTLLTAESNLPTRKPIAQWTTDVIEIGKPAAMHPSRSAYYKDLESMLPASLNLESCLSEQKSASFDLNQNGQAGGLESSRYTIQQGSDRAHPEYAIEQDYIKHADIIKQQIQTYGPKDRSPTTQILDFGLEESPVLAKYPKSPIREDSNIQLRLIPVTEISGAKPSSIQASEYYNTTYFDAGANWQTENPHSLSGSHSGVTRTIGKYSEYSPV
jgi:serine/threonine protein kinase